MPKTRRFLSAYVKKRRQNQGLQKWQQQRREASSQLQDDSLSTNVSETNTLQEMQTRQSSFYSNTELIVSDNINPSIEAVLLDHPYSLSHTVVEDEANQTSLHHSSFNETEIACSSTPLVTSIRNKSCRRRLSLDAEVGENVDGTSRSEDLDKPLQLDDFFAKTSKEINENSRSEPHVVGRRIISFSYFFDQIKSINNHNPTFGCTISNCIVVSEKSCGLKFKVILKCNMCNSKFVLHSDDPKQDMMDVNTGSVAGAMAIGIGHSQIRELFASLEMPYMTTKTYGKIHDKVADAWEETALSEMRAAVAEEIQFAKDNNHLTKDGVPILTVVADGSWAKRSYRTNYNSLAGVAAIVGFHTKKVIFLGVRNKYCTLCARATSPSKEVPEHVCYKNWTGSASSMEADIILEGFINSMDMYGVIFGRLLADGDSSVYASIIEARPYSNVTVEKIECTNHLLRNFCNKVKDIAANSRNGPIKMRKVVGKNILRLRTAVSKAVDHRKSQSDPENENLTALAKDIINGPSHVFGNHTNCDEYFCKGSKDGEINYVPELKQTGIYQQLMKHVNYLADNSRSLLLKMNNNAVEHYNSIVTKFIGGKRVNFAVKRSYKARCLAAAVSYNTGEPLYKLHKSMYNKSPGCIMKTLQAAKRRTMNNKLLRRQENPRKWKTREKNSKQESSKHYGEAAMKPDMPQDVYQRKSKDFLKGLKRTEDEKHELERGTMLQAGSGIWLEERRKLLTASNFATVCKRRETTSCQNLVKSLLYKDFETSSTVYGRENEPVAIQAFEETTGLKVEKCGLFIDTKLPYLGATPDGLIGEDGLVEVKCPASCKSLTPEEGVLNKKFTFWQIDRKLNIIGPVNRSNDYFFQIQGQLHVTQRQYCYLVMWTPLGIKLEKIVRDDEFWEKEMNEKLQKFYINCLLPELIDPRHTRSMPIRDPSYIVEAIKNKEAKQK